MSRRDREIDLMLGTRVAAWRRARGVTQEELAAHLKIDQSSLSAKELGRRKLTIEELLAVCDKLHVPVYFFINYQSLDPRGFAHQLQRAYRRVRQLIQVKQAGKRIGVRGAQDVLDLLDYIFSQPDKFRVGPDFQVRDPLTEELILASQVEAEVEQTLRREKTRGPRQRTTRPRQPRGAQVRRASSASREESESANS
jgi:transcriptional regulator with XRE-family HTH domain